MQQVAPSLPMPPLATSVRRPWELVSVIVRTPRTEVAREVRRAASSPPSAAPCRIQASFSS
jgi:hypothetical protein